MRAILAIAAAGLLGSISAQAVTITYGGIAVDGGTQSRFVISGTTDHLNPEQVSCFSGCTYTGNVIQQGGDDQGHGSYNIYTDSLQNVRLAPNGLSTSSSSTSSPNGAYTVVNDVETQVNNSGGVDAPIYDGFVDFNLGLASVAAGQPATPLTYVGFLWGSPDSYNFIQFVDDAGNVVNTSNNFNGLGTTINGQQYLTGESIFRSAGDGGFASDPGNAGTIFVNFAFDSEQVSGIRIGNFGNCCFEFGNITDSLDPVTDPTPNVGLPGNPRSAGGLPNIATLARAALVVPEPGAGFALLAGLGLLAAARRRRG